MSALTRLRARILSGDWATPVLLCPGCGGDAGDNWFDRSLCACGAMHTCCRACGHSLDGCPLDDTRTKSAPPDSFGASA